MLSVRWIYSPLKRVRSTVIWAPPFSSRVLQLRKYQNSRRLSFVVFLNEFLDQRFLATK